MARPISITWICSLDAENKSGSFTILAPRIIGVARRKENLAAFSRVSPRKSPVEILIPDLDDPGNSATIWLKEITSESINPISLSDLFDSE